jgi:protein-S-isoprenylcysteine O-methyltransferase Ste14
MGYWSIGPAPPYSRCVGRGEEAEAGDFFWMIPTGKEFAMNAIACVVLQFLLCTMIVLSSVWGDRGSGVFSVGLLLVGCGMAISIWAWWSIGWWRLRVMPAPAPPAPDQSEGLITNGAYAYVRHPMYTGVLIAMLGCWIIAPTGWSLVAWLALVGVLLAKSAIEEKSLSELYPEYTAYGARTGRFLPKLLRPRQQLGKGDEPGTVLVDAQQQHDPNIPSDNIADHSGTNEHGTGDAIK